MHYFYSYDRNINKDKEQSLFLGKTLDTAVGVL